MTYFRILTVGLATISLVVGNPQLFSFQIGSPPDEPSYGGSGSRGARYESASSGPRPRYPGGSRVRGPQGFGGPPSSSIYESAPPSSSDYESSPPSSSLYESSSPSNSLYSSGPPSGSPYSGERGPPPRSPYSGGRPSSRPPYSGGPPSSSPYSGGPPSSSLYESAPESSSSDDDESGPYESASPAGDYQSLGGPPSSSGGLTYQSSSARPQYHGRPGGLDGYRSGPPPGFSFQGSPSRPEYLQGGPQGGPRESLPMRIGRGIMGLLASASGPPNFFAPPRGPVYVPASSKTATFYLEPPAKDSPSFYGVRSVASPLKSSSSRVKSPFSFLTSETNNQIPRENSYVLASSTGGRPVQSVQQIVAQAAQAQHAKVLRKEQQAHPSGKITHSQIRLAGAGAGQQIPSQYQSQAYLDPYSAVGIGGQQAGVNSPQLVMTTGPDGNPVLLQVQRPTGGPVQYTGQLPAPGQPQFTGQQPTLLQYTGQQPPQQYSTIGTNQQANAAIAASPQQQRQIIQYIQPAHSQGPISLPNQQAQPQPNNFPSVQFLQPGPGQQAQISPYTVAPQFLTQQQQQPQIQQQGGGIDISQYSLTTEPQSQVQDLYQQQGIYQTLQGQSPFGVSSQDGQQILLNQIGQQIQQLQQQPQLLKQSSNNNQQGFEIQPAIQTHDQQLQPQPLQPQQSQQQQQLGQQSRQVQSQSGSGTSNNPIQFSQQDSIGAFSSISESEQDDTPTTAASAN